MFASYKELLVEVRIIASIILVKFKVMIKKPFELFQFFIKVFLYGFCPIRFSCFDFINSIIVNKLCNNSRLLVFEKAGFVIYTLKSFFQNIFLYFRQAFYN